MPEGLSEARLVARPRTPLAVHAALLLATVLTTTVTGGLWSAEASSGLVALLTQGLRYSLPLLAILLAHESGHYLMCRHHGVDASLPYFLPGPPNVALFGTFGAFIRIRSPFPNRRVLFDIGAGGPWAGFVVAVIALVVGLRWSTVQPLTPGEPGIELGDSLLTDALTRLLIGADPASVRLHPVALAGWFGLFVTSVNLFPVGQLDGGHVLYAFGGRRRPAVPALFIAVLMWLGWHRWLVWLVWSAILGVLMSMGHPPTEADGVPLGRARQCAALATLVLFLMTFVVEPLRIVS